MFNSKEKNVSFFGLSLVIWFPFPAWRFRFKAECLGFRQSKHFTVKHLMNWWKTLQCQRSVSDTQVILIIGLWNCSITSTSSKVLTEYWPKKRNTILWVTSHNTASIKLYLFINFLTYVSVFMLFFFLAVSVIWVSKLGFWHFMADRIDSIWLASVQN